MSKKHTTLDDRYTISKMLAYKQSFIQIASAIGKSYSSVSRKIRNHLEFRKNGAYAHPFNACAHRRNCSLALLCNQCDSKRSHCSLCDKYNSVCPDFQEEKCPKLDKPPYVCISCSFKRNCILEKRYYNARLADEEYRSVLSESRSGISYSEAELKHMDEIVSPLIRKRQSVNHICANNKDSLMVSESTLYRLIDYNLFSARNIDFPRKFTIVNAERKKSLIPHNIT